MVTAVSARIWSLLSPADRIRFLAPVLIAAAWIADTVAGHPAGVPDWLAASLWAVTGAAAVRLLLLVLLIVQVRNSIKDPSS